LEIGPCTDRIGNGTIEVIVREIQCANGRRRHGKFGRMTNVGWNGAREPVAAQIKKLYKGTKEMPLVIRVNKSWNVSHGAHTHMLHTFFLPSAVKLAKLSSIRPCN
jgi:hypothetical protein